MSPFKIFMASFVSGVILSLLFCRFLMGLSWLFSGFLSFTFILFLGFDLRFTVTQRSDARPVLCMNCSVSAVMSGSSPRMLSSVNGMSCWVK